MVFRAINKFDVYDYQTLLNKYIALLSNKS